MGGYRLRFNSSRFTTPSASAVRCEYTTVSKASPSSLITPIDDRNRLATPLLCAEISFLVTLVVFIGLYFAQVYTLRQKISTPVALHREELGHIPQGCSLGLPVQTASSVAIPKSSFTVLEWSSTVSSPIPSFQQEDIHHGPSALLDEDTATSCFAFAGSRGGAVLVSNSEKYHVTQFTLDNSMVGVPISSGYHPKEGAIWGLFEGALPCGLKNVTTSFVAENAIYVLIGNFCFDWEQGSTQTFAVEADIATFLTIKFSAFYLEVLSNWGGSHTCICRLTLHGNT